MENEYTSHDAVPVATQITTESLHIRLILADCIEYFAKNYAKCVDPEIWPLLKECMKAIDSLAILERFAQQNNVPIENKGAYDELS